MAIMNIIEGMPAISQTPPALSSREDTIQTPHLQSPELQDTMTLAWWKTYLHSSQLDLNTVALSSLEAREIRY